MQSASHWLRSVIPRCCSRTDSRFPPRPSVQESVPSSIQLWRVIQGCCFSPPEALRRSAHLSLLLLVLYVCSSPHFNQPAILTPCFLSCSTAAVQNAYKINFIWLIFYVQNAFGRLWSWLWTTSTVYGVISQDQLFNRAFQMFKTCTGWNSVLSLRSQWRLKSNELIIYSLGLWTGISLSKNTGLEKKSTAMFVFLSGAWD